MHAPRIAVISVMCVVSSLGCAKTSASGAADATAEPSECPKDLQAAVGSPCSGEGKICSPGGAAVRMIACSNGKWAELNAPPPPPPASN